MEDDQDDEVEEDIEVDEVDEIVQVHEDLLEEDEKEEKMLEALEEKQVMVGKSKKITIVKARKYFLAFFYDGQFYSYCFCKYYLWWNRFCPGVSTFKVFKRNSKNLFPSESLSLW